MSLFNNLWIGCKQATFLHEKMREGKLSMSETIALRIHLSYCNFCRKFVKQMQALSLYIRKMPAAQGESGSFPLGKKDKLQEAFNRELKNL